MARIQKGNSKNSAASAQTESAALPAWERPWEDWSLDAAQRYSAYRQFVLGKIADVERAILSARGDPMLRNRITMDPETLYWIAEAKFLGEEPSAEQVVEHLDRDTPRTLLGKNFLGAKAWRASGVEVGKDPPLPASITKKLLEADCPFHPGKKIKETHLLVLIPELVDGQPFTARALEAISKTRKGSGEALINPEERSWKKQEWATLPQERSQWVLIPKADPEPEKVPRERHFKSKSPSEQRQVHQAYYKEYRVARPLELMTAILLNDLTNGAPRMLVGFEYLRCEQPGRPGHSICIGRFGPEGLEIFTDDGQSFGRCGLALAR